MANVRQYFSDLFQRKHLRVNIPADIFEGKYLCISEGKYLCIYIWKEIYFQTYLRENIWGWIYVQIYLKENILADLHERKYLRVNICAHIFEGKYSCSLICGKIFEGKYVRKNIYEGKYLLGKPFDLVSHPSTKHLDTNISPLLKHFKLLKIISSTETFQIVENDRTWSLHLNGMCVCEGGWWRWLWQYESGTQVNWLADEDDKDNDDDYDDNDD